MAKKNLKEPQAPRYKDIEYTVSASRLNVRTAAGYNADIAKENGADCVLNKGDKITVSKTKKASCELWGMIDSDKWVCLSFCNKKAD